MTPFRKRSTPATKRMAEDMLIRNMAVRTIDTYTCRPVLPTARSLFSCAKVSDQRERAIAVRAEARNWLAALPPRDLGALRGNLFRAGRTTEIQERATELTKSTENQGSWTRQMRIALLFCNTFFMSPGDL